MRGIEQNGVPQSHCSPPAARYLSSCEIESVIRLLAELRELTSSRSSHARATNTIINLGGTDRLEAIAPDRGE
jgi:hypothetical protein